MPAKVNKQGFFWLNSVTHRNIVNMSFQPLEILKQQLLTCLEVLRLTALSTFLKDSQLQRYITVNFNQALGAEYDLTPINCNAQYIIISTLILFFSFH